MYEAASKAGDMAKMKTAMNEAVKACSGGACFTAGTLIETSEGYKAVEQFTGGELVWARNDVTHRIWLSSSDCDKSDS